MKIDRLKREAGLQARAIAAESDQAVWEPRLRAFIGDLSKPTVAFWPQLVFEQLGVLRDKLLLLAEDPRWEDPRLLLALRDDPRDEALVRRFVARNQYAALAPRALTGKTVNEALERWREHHFEVERVPGPRTSNWLTVLARTDHHALVEHYVRYQHWAYTTELTARKQDGHWTVRLVLEGIRVRFER